MITSILLWWTFLGFVILGLWPTSHWKRISHKAQGILLISGGPFIWILGIICYIYLEYTRRDES